MNDCPPPTVTNLPDKPRLKPPSVLPDKDRKPPLSLAQEAKQLAADLGGVYAGYYERLMANTEHDREWDDIAPESEPIIIEPFNPDTIQPDSPDDWDNEPFEAPEVPNNPWDDEPPEMTNRPVYGSSPATLANNTDSQNAGNSIPLTNAGVIAGKTSSHSQLITESSPMFRGGAVGSHSTKTSEHGTRIHKMAIYKAKVENGYTQIPNETLQSSGLTADALGVLVHILSLPCDFKINPTYLRKQFPQGANNPSIMGRERLDRILREFEDNGYMVKKKVRKESGQYAYDYFVYPVKNASNPQENTEKLRVSPHTGNPALADPVPANPALKKETSKKETFKKTILESKSDDFDAPDDNVVSDSVQLFIRLWYRAAIENNFPIAIKSGINGHPIELFGKTIKERLNEWLYDCTPKQLLRAIRAMAEHITASDDWRHGDNGKFSAGIAFYLGNPELNNFLITVINRDEGVTELHTQQDERQPALNEKQG